MDPGRNPSGARLPEGAPAGRGGPSRARRVLRLLLIASLGGGVLLIANLLLGKEAPGLLLRSREWIAAFVDAHLIGALGFFFLAYAACACLFLPGALWLSVAAGFALGFAALPWMALTVAAGDLLASLLARRLFRARFERRLGARLSALRSEIERRGWRYLLALRLMPGVPYPLLNAACALSPVRARAQFLTTLAGFAPACALYVWAGTRLRAADGGGSLVDPLFLLALAALALSVAAPALLSALRRFKQRRTSK